MDEIVAEIETAEVLSFERSFELARQCSTMTVDDPGRARIIVINVLNNWHKIFPSTVELWTDLIEAVGFYPYIYKNQESILLKNLSGEIRQGLSQSENLENKFFHDEQKEILNILSSGQNVIVSAPTSFGKSLLIEELVASLKYTNIVIIQPTLALLDETRRKLIKYKDRYKLVVRTSQEPSTETGNIFLFTAERVNEYRFFPKIEFIVLDEFYKLSGRRDDERSSSLNNAFYYLLKHHQPRFYLLGPNIDSVSKGFDERYNAHFYSTKYSLVDSRTYNVYEGKDELFGAKGKKKMHKELALFELLETLSSQQTIIYCSSPYKVRYLAKKFSDFLEHKGHDLSLYSFPLLEWIDEYIGKDWCLYNYLQRYIGIHDGALQKHITTSIIDYFNEQKLRYLFCTSTIIEGVNTSAKNIVYFDSQRGTNEVDYFDYSNIKGRAGRMMEHYIGNIYNFNKPPLEEAIAIDIPFFQQNPIKDEVLIQLDEEEVINKDNEQFLSIQRLPKAEKELIKLNGVLVKGQKNIIDQLRQSIKNDYELLAWELPKYEQLNFVLSLAWNNLIVPGETTRPMTLDKLVYMTFNYGINKDINSLVDSRVDYLRKQDSSKDKSISEVRDLAIQETFQIMKHWFEYKVPKWISVINELQKFICLEAGLKPGNYTHYANMIENDFLRENLSILAEYGIPSSAIRKIERYIPSTLNQDLVLKYIEENKTYDAPDFLHYEKIKIKNNIV